ncbi:hypothetical protein B0H17DRAFT_952168 [Mycena rosella]|uniref:Uncharacterized protein n=1 Tax=Mycena rosella TaxID=1033263 RepID=A0AAD7G7U6_MYCRO|nr:hypothetical protein B0H17DRAFT_952168 [Mycena rosella]
MMFPGPSEPTTEQYNNVVKIVVEQFKKLYDGKFYSPSYSALKTYTSQFPDAVEFPKFPQTKTLRALGPGFYRLVFRYLKDLWLSVITLVPDVDLTNNEKEISFSGDVESYSHVWVNKRRYGAATQHRGKSAQYAYIDNRVPVRIAYIFRVHVKLGNETKLTAACAVVRRFQHNSIITNFPWDLRATDLCVGVWEAQSVRTLEVVALEQFTGHFVLGSITVREQDLWITIAHDHVRRSQFPCNYPF